MLRHDWTLDEIRQVHQLPLPELFYRAQTAHRAYHDPQAVQGCALLSIKTGHCPEDCAYCPQSARYDTGLEAQGLLSVEETLDKARAAKAGGATRFCMGAAWREAPEGDEFERVVEMVRGVRGLGMEACCTLGMLTQRQADRLAEAGLTAYNHNLDTSPEFYGEIITTRSYQERLDTLDRVRRSGVTICCGGIIGMGESVDDRLGLLLQLARQDPHPESVPINSLVSVAGACCRARFRARDRDRPHRDARIHRAPVGGPHGTVRRGASPLLSGRRELRVPRRAALDHPEPRSERRRKAAREDGDAPVR